LVNEMLSYVFARDCIKGVGWPILKNAYEILGRIEEDEVEVMSSFSFTALCCILACYVS